MQITAKDLAFFLNGEIVGNPDAVATQPGKIDASRQGDICFLSNSQYENYVYTTVASIILVDKNFLPKQEISATLIRVNDVYASVALLLEKFGEKKRIERSEISSRASVHATAKIGERVVLGDFTVIEEGAVIGDDCVIYPQVYVGKNSIIGSNALIYAGVKIYRDCSIGTNFIAQSGAVIGSDGFGFALQPDGSYKKIQHLGTVIIEDDVEIGANCAIDRGTIGATIIRRGVKLDNLIQVAHNVEIGEHTVMAAQAGVAGSAKIGKFNRIGGQVAIVGHIKLGDHVQVQGQSGVISNVPDQSKLYGTPAIEYRNYLRSYAVFKKLPEIYLAKKTKTEE